MLDFITKFFRRDESSKSLAKERLRLVLMSDRVSLAPETFAAMKGEMLGVLQRYLEIDEHGLDVHFENAERRFMLLANIPVTHVKTNEQMAHERQQLTISANGAGSAPSRTPARRKRRRRRSSTNGSASPEGGSSSTPTAADNRAEDNNRAEDAKAGAADGGHSAPNGATADGTVTRDDEPESDSHPPNGGENQEP